MLTRAFVIWVVILLCASANGILRAAVIIPRVGEEPGRALSTLLLSAIIVLVTWWSIEWIAPPSEAAAIQVGLFWVVLTLAFEFLGGHYLFGNSWEALLADYDVLRGRIWVLALLVTGAAPWAAAVLRGVIRRTVIG